jgi:predicted RNA binding protein YcfA (HicA-like mRNA interferase family)
MGFEFVREGKGAHRIYAHPDGRMTSISFHPGDVSTGTLRKIISSIGLSVEDFNEMV